MKQEKHQGTQAHVQDEGIRYSSFRNFRSKTINWEEIAAKYVGNTNILMYIFRQLVILFLQKSGDARNVYQISVRYVRFSICSFWGLNEVKIESKSDSYDWAKR